MHLPGFAPSWFAAPSRLCLKVISSFLYASNSRIKDKSYHVTPVFTTPLLNSITKLFCLIQGSSQPFPSAGASFPFSSQFVLFLPIFPDFPTFCGWFFQISSHRGGGALCPLPPYGIGLLESSPPDSREWRSTKDYQHVTKHARVPKLDRVLFVSWLPKAAKSYTNVWLTEWYFVWSVLDITRRTLGDGERPGES